MRPSASGPLFSTPFESTMGSGAETFSMLNFDVDIELPVGDL